MISVGWKGRETAPGGRAPENRTFGGLNSQMKTLVNFEVVIKEQKGSSRKAEPV